MNDVRFARAAALVKALGRADVGPQGDLATALRIGLPFSLWEVVETTLLMYRFPLLFSPRDGTAVPATREMRLRPYRGLLARARDRVSRPSRTSAGVTRWPREGRAILFPGFVEGFYRDVLQTVAERLSQDGTPVVVLREGPAPVMQWSATAPMAHSIWEHWDREAGLLERDLRSRLHEVAGALFARDRLADWCDALWPEFGKVALAHDLRWLFWRELPRLLPRVVIATRIFAKHAPELVVSADDADPRCRIYALLANSTSVPTLLVQQGLLRHDVPEYQFLAHDRIAAMGQSSVDDMVAHGVAADRIVVTGQPGFDEMTTASGQANDIRAELGLPPGAKVTLFASQPPVPGAFVDKGSRREMIATLVRLVARAEDRVLVIKPHPGDRVDELLALARGASNVKIVDRRRSIAPFIRACDVFVTFFSTSALQALYAGKPVINLDFAGDEGVLMYADSSATWVARSAEELASHLDQLLGDRAAEAVRSKTAARGRILAAVVHHTDGLATARVCEVARALVARRKEAPCA